MDEIDGRAWLPARLRTDDTTAGSLFVMSLPTGLAIRYTEYHSNVVGLREWMFDYFRRDRDEVRRSELDEPTALIFVVARRDAKNHFQLQDAGISTFPAVPENWPEVPYRELLGRALQFLAEPAKRYPGP